MTFHKSKNNTTFVCEPVWLFVRCTKPCYQWTFSRCVANDTYVPENSRKLLKTPIYLFLWFMFPTCYHTSFYPLSFHFLPRSQSARISYFLLASPTQGHLLLLLAELHCTMFLILSKF